MITTKVEQIRPKQAQKYLDMRDEEHQRHVKPAVVRSYASSMQAGFWTFNAETIKFDTEGHLIDGQHRLQAVVESGTTQKFLIVRGLPIQTDKSVYTIDTIDRGAIRTVGEQLHIRHGIKNSNAVAACIRSIGKMVVTTHGWARRIDVGRTLAIWDLYKSSIVHVLDGFLTGESLRIWRKASVYAPMVVAHHVASAQIEDFINQISTGENLKPSTPAHSLFRWRCNDGMKATPTIITNAVALAAKKHYEGQHMKTVNKMSRAGVMFWLSLQPRNTEKIIRLFNGDN